MSSEREYLENFGLEGLGGMIYPGPWAKIYRSELFKAKRFAEGMVFEDSLLLTELFKTARNIHLIDQGCYAYMYNSDGTMGGGLTKKKACDALKSHLATLEACRGTGVDIDRYRRFWDVVFYDTYCAVSYFRRNIFAVEELKRLWALKPGYSGIMPGSEKLVPICGLVGISNFMRLTAAYRQCRSALTSVMTFIRK